MIHDNTRHKFLLLFAAAGLGISVFTALEGQWDWLASLCGWFGDGCRETTGFKLLEIPLWLWGSAYYLALISAILSYRAAVFWLVMVGLGVEISLVWTMISMKLICIFCLLNVFVVFVLAGLCLAKHRIWQAMAISLLVVILSTFSLPRERPARMEAWSERLKASVVAQVGDETITALDLESPLATQLYRMQNEIYNLKRNHLEELINEILLRKEAEQKEISVQQLTESILSARKLVSEEEVENYYRKNSSRWVNWTGSQEELRNRIRSYLQSQKDRQEIVNHVKPLRNRFPVAIHLQEPPLPFSKVSVGNSPAWGPSDAEVTVVEFSDYLCPACRAAHASTKKIREQYAGKIRWVFKNYPLERHPGAKKLAEAALCAEEQGKFWKFQDLLFASPKKPNLGDLEQYAEQLGLDVKRFTSCFESGKFAANVEMDINEARHAGVNATPTFIINGKLRPGSLSLDEFKQIVDAQPQARRSN